MACHKCLYYYNIAKNLKHVPFEQLSLFINSLYTLMHLEIVTVYMFQHQVHSPVTCKSHTVLYNGVQYAVSLYRLLEEVQVVW